jgi:hypothetical protein
MPGLFVALAAFAVLAFSGVQAKKFSERVLLTAGRRYLITVSFATPPDQGLFERTFRSVYPGLVSVSWRSPQRADLVVTEQKTQYIDIGTPLSSGGAVIADARELPAETSIGRLAPRAVSAWLIRLETASPVLDKLSFERSLLERLNARLVRASWRGPRELDLIVVVPAMEDVDRQLARSPGTVRQIRSTEVTVTMAKKLPASRS